MRFLALVSRFFIVGLFIPAWTYTTHAEGEQQEPVTVAQAEAPKVSAVQSIKEAPTFLTKKDITRKERIALKKQYRHLTSGKVLKGLSEPELRTVADISITLGWYDDALNFLKKLEKKTKNTTVVKNVKLEIADITFQEGNLKGAAKLYDEYINLYPGDKEKAAYAKYKGILSNFYSMLQQDRDQTATHKTIALADAFLEGNNTIFKKYAYDVESIKYHCQTQLYEHDVVVFDFYLKKQSFKAAEKRLASMRGSLLPKRSDLEPKFLECELRLAQAQRDEPRITRISQELTTRFPEEVRLAQAKKAIPNYVARF